MIYLADRMDSLYMASDFEGYEAGILLVKNQAAEILAAAQAADVEKLKQLLNSKAVSLGRAKPKCEESTIINEKIRFVQRWRQFPMSFNIYLTSVQQIKTFVELAAKQAFEVRVGNDRQSINGKDFIRTYSDSGHYVVRDGVEYSEAIDPAEFGRTYTEGAVMQMSETQQKALAYDIIMGVAE